MLDAVSKAAAGDNEGIELITSQLHDRHLSEIKELVKDPSERLIVASEIGKLLDQFSSLCQAIMVLGEASPRAHDAIASLGERMSTRILSAALRSSGIDSEAVDATRLIITDNQYQSANPDFKASLPTTIETLEPLFTKGITPVVTGFIGATKAGVTTTLGRGGSDFTAAILGVLLKADEVWIWTDVDGVMTSDPRIVPAAQTIERISFREISELAYFGAKVLHPKTIRPIIEAGITLKVLNTLTPIIPEP